MPKFSTFSDKPFSMRIGLSTPAPKAWPALETKTTRGVKLEVLEATNFGASTLVSRNGPTWSVPNCLSRPSTECNKKPQRFAPRPDPGSNGVMLNQPIPIPGIPRALMFPRVHRSRKNSDRKLNAREQLARYLRSAVEPAVYQQRKLCGSQIRKRPESRIRRASKNDMVVQKRRGSATADFGTRYCRIALHLPEFALSTSSKSAFKSKSKSVPGETLMTTSSQPGLGCSDLPVNIPALSVALGRRCQMVGIEVNKGRGNASEFETLETLLASYHHHRQRLYSHPFPLPWPIPLEVFCTSRRTSDIPPSSRLPLAHSRYRLILFRGGNKWMNCLITTDRGMFSGSWRQPVAAPCAARGAPRAQVLHEFATIVRAEDDVHPPVARGIGSGEGPPPSMHFAWADDDAWPPCGRGGAGAGLGASRYLLISAIFEWWELEQMGAD
ncbi:hypothetical protein DFH06DRAFT_1139885 [Mycena polygramma]|nr:hypothetical protein DFH06DRAFT_1139885 [Mycena polygramma]